MNSKTTLTMASADLPTITTLHHWDNSTTSTGLRLPLVHPAVQKLRKLTYSSPRTGDVADFGPSSAWRVPPPPPEPPPPPQPPPPSWPHAAAPAYPSDMMLSPPTAAGVAGGFLFRRPSTVVSFTTC